MSKVTEDLKAAEAKLVEAAKDAATGKEGEAAAALAEAGKDVKQAAVDAVAEVKGAVKEKVDAVETAVKAQVERVKGVFKTKFGFPLHDHTQNVTITPEGVPAEHSDWIQGQIEAGTVVKVEADAPAAPAAPATPAAAPAPEAK